MKRPFRTILLVFLIGLPTIFLLAALTIFSAWSYTATRLELAKKEGVYDSVEEGMLSRIERRYNDIERIQLEHAGSNSFDGTNPHVGFAVAKVWAGSRRDGSPVGNQRHNYDFPGSYFLHTKQGWVHMPEGAFPEFIGFWMKVFDLAGEAQ